MLKGTRADGQMDTWFFIWSDIDICYLFFLREKQERKVLFKTLQREEMLALGLVFVGLKHFSDVTVM